MSETRKRTRKIARRHDPQGPLRAIVYTRLSKAKDTRRNTEVGLDTQREGCQNAIAALGGAVVGYESDIISRDRIDRPGLWRAIETIKAGEANCLIVYKIDRLGSDHEQQGVVVRELRRSGARLLSATENLEEGPLGDVLRALYTYGAAVELAAIRERTARGFDARFRQRQRYKPGQRPPYGYRRIGSGEDATYEIDPAEAEVVIRIFRERAQGRSIRGILRGLRADGIPSPTGRGPWGTSTIAEILGRTVYATGEMECWRTQTVRDADGVPFVEARPQDERYVVMFPVFLDPVLIDRARETKRRNQWSTARADRPAEVALLRYGFIRCGGCGRALSVSPRSNGHIYTCTGAYPDDPHRCPARPSMTVDLLDGPAWWWVQRLIEDPRRAESYQITPRVDALDEVLAEGLRAAEAEIADLEAQSATLLQNLSYLTGEAARAAGERLNALAEDVRLRKVARDALSVAATASAAAFPPVPALTATDALGALVVDAINAMKEADPEPEETHEVVVWTRNGGARLELPRSWKARRAALSVFGVTVTLNQTKSDQPRWVAEMRLPGGETVSGSWPECGPNAPYRPYMSTSSR